MKKNVPTLFTLALLLCATFNLFSSSYFISFTGSGESTSLDSVKVMNLFKGTQVTVPSGSILELSDGFSAVNNLFSTNELTSVYPNPTFDFATYSFFANNAGKIQIEVIGMDAKSITKFETNILQGKNALKVTLPQGTYLIKTTGTDFYYTSKLISFTGMNVQPKIEFSGVNQNNDQPQKVHSSTVKLLYDKGDQLLYKGYSKNYCTIVTDKPSETKTTDFKFVKCTDADGNNYSVVHIGSQTWMAENLKTKKFRNGETISEQAPYNNDQYNADKYGRLYTWIAATDIRNIAPIGWHVPSDEEWTNLQTYLIANGYNYNGITTNNLIGKSLCATTDWWSHSTTGTIGTDLRKNNSSGFGALPGGLTYDLKSFNYIGGYGYWWSSTERHSTSAWSRNLVYSQFHLNTDYGSKTNAYSVRCLKD